MSTRITIGAALVAASLASLAGAQQGAGTGNPGNPNNPGNGAQPTAPADPNAPAGTPQTPGPAAGAPAAPQEPRPEFGPHPDGRLDLGAPGQPGGAPPCPADNPTCNPNNPASPTDSSRRQDGSVVPAPQQNRSGDTDGRLTSRVRETIMRGGAATLDGLSVSAAAGKVTLRGQVRSEQEKAALERRAAAVAGEGNVVNELTIVP